MSNADEQDFEMMDDDEDTGREVAVAIELQAEDARL